MTIAVRYKGEGYDYFINIPFRHCKADDFKKRGLIGTQETLLKYEKTHFCPEFDKYKDFIKVKNLYNNAKERVSFSVEIYQCNPNKRSCEKEDKIERFLTEFIITLSTLVDRVEFSETYHEVSKREEPIKTLFKFHSQFSISTKKYRDNNNFLQINKGDHNDHRFNPFKQDESFFFVDYIAG
jgi:hypothetical protein